MTFRRACVYLTVLILGGPFLLGICGCGSTPSSVTYNINFQPKSFRVADSLELSPQGGDDASSDTGATGTASGGPEVSPGGSNVLDGFAQQGIIIQIGTSAKPETGVTATTDASLEATVTPSTTPGTP